MMWLLYLSFALSSNFLVYGKQQHLEIGKKGICLVVEIASGKKKSCEAEFTFENETYYGCTMAGGKSLVPWCSTKVEPNTKEHIIGQGFYGDCPMDGSCLTEEEGEKFYNDLRQNEENRNPSVRAESDSCLSLSCNCQSYSTCSWSSKMIHQLTVLPKKSPILQSFVFPIP